MEYSLGVDIPKLRTNGFDKLDLGGIDFFSYQDFHVLTLYSVSV